VERSRMEARGGEKLECDARRALNRPHLASASGVHYDAMERSCASANDPPSAWGHFRVQMRHSPTLSPLYFHEWRIFARQKPSFAMCHSLCESKRILLRL
jgi:hypothetical protein